MTRLAEKLECAPFGVGLRRETRPHHLDRQTDPPHSVWTFEGPWHWFPCLDRTPDLAVATSVSATVPLLDLLPRVYEKTTWVRSCWQTQLGASKQASKQDTVQQQRHTRQ